MTIRNLATVLALTLAAPVCADTGTRTSGFDYEPTTPFLTREVIEPGNPILCLVTVYTPDSFGNRATTTTRNCSGPTGGFVNEAAAPTGDAVFPQRTSNITYSGGSISIGGVAYTWNAGQFATTVRNAVNHQETRAYDPRFGAAATLTGPNNLTTSWTYDNFGRKSSETRVDGSVTNWFYERCVDLAGACPAFGQYRVRVTATASPTTSTYFDSLNREIRTETQGFDGTLVRKDTQYDALGRVAQVSRPYYVGATPVWTVLGYDILGRVITTLEPATTAGQALTRTTYSGLVTRVEASNSDSGANMPAGAKQTQITTKNSQGQVVQVDRQ